MDTYIAGDPALESTPKLHARLPGELDSEPPHGEPPLDPPLRAGPRTAGSTPSAPHRKRRRTLLAAVAVVGLVVIAGGAFAVSPYNTVVPVPAGAKIAAARAENQLASLWRHPISTNAPHASNGAVEPAVTVALLPGHPLPAPAPVVQSPPPLAPAATLAGVHAVQQPVAVVQPPYKPQPQGQELAELLGLGQAIPPVPSPVPAPPLLHPAGPAQPPQGATQAASKAVPAAQRAPSQAAMGNASSEPTAQYAVSTAWTAGPEFPVAQPPAPHAGSPGVAVSAGSPAAVEAPASPAPPAAGPSGGLRIVAATPASSPAVPPKGTAAGDHVPTVNAAALVLANPVSAAEHLQAAPMSSDQQVQVLELVTQLAALIRDEKTQIANLQSDIQKNDGATSVKLVDFERRLALVEANSAMAAASAPLVNAATPALPNPGGSNTPAVPVALLSAKAALAGAHQDPPTAASPPVPPASSSGQPAAATTTQYHVQAASPGLAMLAAVDRGGGDGAQIQVQVGDAIPGYGRVLSVQQKGTNWVVQTQNGLIQ